MPRVRTITITEGRVISKSLWRQLGSGSFASEPDDRMGGERTLVDVSVGWRLGIQELVHPNIKPAFDPECRATIGLPPFFWISWRQFCPCVSQVKVKCSSAFLATAMPI